MTETLPPFVKVEKSSWPKARLAPNEEQFFSVSCGNTSLQWALHGCKAKSLHPVYFWRTPHLTEEDVDIDSRTDLVHALSRHLADDANNYLFGKADATIEAAQECTKERGHAASFYIVSSSPNQLQLLSKIIGSIPCRIFEMQASDFFTQDEGAYEGMGTDRLANALGAANVDGLPALVIDGGSALTYTALGNDGTIIGGGISPGMAMRLKAMNQFTGALPAIDLETEMTALLERKNAASIFGRSTTDAMVRSILHEVTCHLRGVVNSWKEIVTDQKKRGRPSRGSVVKRKNDKRLVSITGGSGKLIMKILSEDNGGVLDTSMKDAVKCKFVTGLIHFGITHAICNRSGTPHQAADVDENAMKKKKTHKKNRDYDKYIGQKVAKDFIAPDSDGDYTYRGKVKSHEEFVDEEGVKSEIFRVLYADNDEEDVSEEELINMIAHYKKVGEKLPDPLTHADQYINARVAKIFFGDQCFYGTVKSFSNKYWSITYDDGDNEDMDSVELINAIKLHCERKYDDPENTFQDFENAP